MYALPLFNTKLFILKASEKKLKSLKRTLISRKYLPFQITKNGKHHEKRENQFSNLTKHQICFVLTVPSFYCKIKGFYVFLISFQKLDHKSFLDISVQCQKQ